MTDARNYIGLAAGMDMPDPGDDVARPLTAPAPAAPDDGLGDVPFRVISLEEIADVDSGTAVARARARAKLAEQYGVTHMTIDRALKVLKDEGLVFGVPGLGVFVKEDR